MTKVQKTIVLLKKSPWIAAYMSSYFYTNSWTDPIDAKGNDDITLCIQSFFRRYFKVNVSQYSDTFLSKPKPQILVEHYFCYCPIVRMLFKSEALHRSTAYNSLIDSEKFIMTKLNVSSYKLLVSSLWIFMFVVIIFWKQSVNSAHWKVPLRHG